MEVLIANTPKLVKVPKERAKSTSNNNNSIRLTSFNRTLRKKNLVIFTESLISVLFKEGGCNKPGNKYGYSYKYYFMFEIHTEDWNLGSFRYESDTR